jgi:hypothetical protein
MLEGFHMRNGRQAVPDRIHTTGRHHIGSGRTTTDDLARKRKAKILVFAERRAIYQCRRSAPIASNVNQLIWW